MLRDDTDMIHNINENINMIKRWHDKVLLVMKKHVPKKTKNH